MNTENKPKTEKMSDETSAKLLRWHIEDATKAPQQSTSTEPDYKRGDDGTVHSLLIALLILAVMLLVIWFSK
jgi:hypothetical protein